MAVIEENRIAAKEGTEMSEIYITITGTNHFHGTEFMEPKMEVTLRKDPDNEYDSEAIKAEMPGLGQVGHVANSTYTVLGESMSAGRLYDRIGDTARAEILYVLPKGVVCRVCGETVLYTPPGGEE